MAVYSVKNSNGRFTLRLTLTQGEPITAENKSPVSYKLELIANTAYNFELYSIGSKVVIDGKTVHYQERTTTKQYSIADYGTLKLAEGSTPISHNSDGSKAISFSYSIDMKQVDYTPGPLSSSGTMTLTSIARKATVTSAKSFKDHENPEFSFSNPGGFDVVPYFNVYDKATNEKVFGVTRDKGKYPSTYTIELTDDERSKMLAAANTSNEYSVWIGVSSYNGSDYIDYDSKNVTLSIVDANPIFIDEDVSYVDSNPITYALTDNEGQGIVSGISTVDVICKAAKGVKGATISKYNISLHTAYGTITSAGGGTAPLGTVSSDTDLTLRVYAVDSRGNSTLVEKTVTMFPYSEPKLAYHHARDFIECARCDENGVLDKKGTHLKVVVQGKWSAFPNGKNIGKLQVMYATKNEESGWYDLTTDNTLGNASNLYVAQGEFDGVAPGVTLAKTKSYTVTIRCIDSLDKAAKVSYRIPTQVVDFHLRKGAAFGEYVTEENTLKLSNEWTANGLYSLGRCVQLSENADANNCLDFRVYGVAPLVASSISNLPEAIGGTLRVFSADGRGLSATDIIYIIQEYTTLSGHKVYRRRAQKNVGENEWKFYTWYLYQQQIT